MKSPARGDVEHLTERVQAINIGKGATAAVDATGVSDVEARAPSPSPLTAVSPVDDEFPTPRAAVSLLY